MDNLESALLETIKGEEYWKKRCELLEQSMGEILSSELKTEIIKRALSHAGSKAHSQKDNPDSQEVHADAISKPEVTENYVRIPMHDCKITATIDIDKEHGIKALYCGQEKMIATYLFPKDNYSMAEAEAWIKEHEKSKQKTEKMQKSYTVPIAKMDDEKHLIYGIVLEPDTVDTQDDIVSVDEIEKACHKFMKDSQIIFSEHRDKEPECEVVENYIAPDNFKMGESEVKKGSWIMVTYCGNEELWGQVKKGEITGYSIRGYANRTE